jgi:hypothetical protein
MQPLTRSRPRPRFFGTSGPSFALDFVNGTNALDPRVTFTRASSATYFDSAGVLQSAANNVPRFDYNPATLAARGLLIEESRTNSIRNNTMQGAVAGTPGTAPTNWVAQNLGGVALTEVVGTGTENGIAYVDVRYTGTTSTNATGAILAELGNQISAASGQVWTHTSFVKLVGGSTANLTSIDMSILERDSGGTLLAATNTSITPTGAALNTQRFTATRTLNNASTAFVQPRIAFVPAAFPVAIDITLRIGLPQLEQGAFATSVIPTTTTALTRAADVASVNTLSPWFNSAEGSVYVSATLLNAPTSLAGASLYSLSNGTTSERISVLTGGGSGGNINTIVTDDAVLQAQTVNGGLSTAGTYNYANAYKVNDFASVVNGGTAVTDGLGSLPTVDRLILGANAVGNTGFLNGYLRRIVYYPRRLSNAELQSITS